MADLYDSEQVDQRLDELYQRHRLVDPRCVGRFYEPGRGYYAPTEATRAADLFGIAFATDEGHVHVAGDADKPFALQSLSKVFVYGLALEDRGREEVLRHVGVEPSAEAFNSIVLDERHHRPYNPMVNAGALVTTDLVRGSSGERKLERLLGVMQTCAGDTRLRVN